MRKSKDIKRKKKLAGIEYRRGNKTEAYKMWTEAAKELKDLRGRAQTAAAAASAE